MKAAAAALLCGGAALAASACPPGGDTGERLDAGPLQLTWRAEPAPIVAGQPFVLRIVLCPAEARLSAVDATMPEHRHGMNYRVKLQPQGGGQWRAEGLLWHMSGRWELRFDAEFEGRRHTLRQSVVLQ